MEQINVLRENQKLPQAIKSWNMLHHQEQRGIIQMIILYSLYIANMKILIDVTRQGRCTSFKPSIKITKTLAVMVTMHVLEQEVCELKAVVMTPLLENAQHHTGLMYFSQTTALLKDSVDGYTSHVKPSARFKCYISLWFRAVIHVSVLREIKDEKKRQTTLTDGRPL